MGYIVPPQAILIGVSPVAVFKVTFESVFLLDLIGVWHYLEGRSV
tara:strand:+ start:443 stop:577 length:135 start_codon:yes stop_codon:yes gene_type:complete